MAESNRISEYDYKSGALFGRVPLPTTNALVWLGILAVDGDLMLAGSTASGMMVSWQLKKLKLECVALPKSSSKDKDGADFSSFALSVMKEQLYGFLGSSSSNNLTVMNLTPSKSLDDQKTLEDVSITVKLMRKKSGICTLAFHSHLGLLAIGTSDGFILVYDLKNAELDYNKETISWKIIAIVDTVAGECVSECKAGDGGRATVSAISFHPTEPILIAGNSCGDVLVIHAAASKVVSKNYRETDE